MLFSALYEFKYPPDVSPQSRPQTSSSSTADSSDFVEMASTPEPNIVSDFIQYQPGTLPQDDTFVPSDASFSDISAAVACSPCLPQAQGEGDFCFSLAQAPLDVTTTDMQNYFSYDRAHHGLDNSTCFTNGPLSYPPNRFFY
jgi:hypothetical protein